MIKNNKILTFLKKEKVTVAMLQEINLSLFSMKIQNSPVSPVVMWDAAKATIRGYIIYYTAAHKKALISNPAPAPAGSPRLLPGHRTVGCPLLQVCALEWVKCREHISLLIILCIIVYVTNKANLSLICICL